MAYTQEFSQKSIGQYLQNAILQLLNDHISYVETLQVLGVLCVTVDNKKDEVVVKVNSTLKRVTSLTPPKECSPDPKNSALILRDTHAKNAGCFDNRKIKSNEITISNVGRGVGNLSSSNFPLCHSNSYKSRGRKQSKPAKVKSLEYDETLNEDDEVCEMKVDEEIPSATGVKQDLIVSQDDNGDGDCEHNSGQKRKYPPDSGENGLEVSDAELPKNFASYKPFSTDLCIKTELQGEECSSDVGLDLSLFPRRNSSSLFENKSCVALAMNTNMDKTKWNGNHTINNKQTAFIPCSSTLFQDAPTKDTSFPASTNITQNFITLMKQSSPFQSHASYYRKILPASICSSDDINTQGINNSKYEVKLFQPTSHVHPESFEFKTEDDYLLDCLNSDGKKRRRRSLEDALTADEMHEYLGSRERPTDTSFACRICNESSPDLLKYFHHTLSCHKAFICHQCGRCFTTKSSLLRHRPIHTGLRRFACGICHKAFYRKDKCKAHIKKHAEAREDPEGSKNLQVL